MSMSPSVGKLAEALARAQGQMSGAKLDAKNPQFNSKYATLASVLEACREPLAANGLAIVQSTHILEADMVLETILLHATGEWIASEYPIRPYRQVKNEGWQPAEDPQSIGSALSYARRYALSAMIGIAEDDDDGNLASQPTPASARNRPANAASPAPAATSAARSAPPAAAQAAASPTSANSPSVDQVVPDAEKREAAEEAAADASARTGVAVVRGDGSDYANSTRPWSAVQVIAALHQARANVKPGDKANGLWGAALGILDEIGTQERHMFFRAVWSVESASDLSEAQKIATQRWVKPTKADPTGSSPKPKWVSDNPHMAAELAAVTEYFSFEA